MSSFIDRSVNIFFFFFLRRKNVFSCVCDSNIMSSSEKGRVFSREKGESLFVTLVENIAWKLLERGI